MILRFYFNNKKIIMMIPNIVGRVENDNIIFIYCIVLILNVHVYVLQYDYADVNVFYPHENAYDMFF